MMEFSGRTRGTAYVSFCGQESVAKALQMDYMELRNGYLLKSFKFEDYNYTFVIIFRHKLRIHKSFDNKCLYIGKLPPNCSKINLGAALESITNQRIYDLYIHRVKKAGCKDYALIRYPTHCDAILARKVLQKLQIFINNQPINVDWADYDPLDFDGNLVENVSIRIIIK